MPTYISLVQFTDKGIQAAKETTVRVAEWATKVESMGVSVKGMYWTLGQYDQVCVFRPLTTRRPPPCCSQRICWETFARKQCVLSRPPRWRRSWPRCPDPTGFDSGIAGPTVAVFPQAFDTNASTTLRN
jgi:hypothetical protein